MNKAYGLFILSFLFLAACKKAEDKNCYMSTPDLTVADKQVTVSINETAENYDLEYGTQGFTQGSGTTETFSGAAGTYPVTHSFNVTTYAVYDVYIRKKCNNGGVGEWVKKSVNVDGSYSSCQTPVSLDVNTTSYSHYHLNWYGNGNFYDVEYGPSGFTIGNGTRIRTNNQYTEDEIMHAGVTYDFYVRANCGGNVFSSWAGPHSVYAATDQNINVPCTPPTGLYAYYTSSTEINYTAVGHGSISYEVSISSSASSLTSNILSVSSPNGGLYNSGGYIGTHYCWLRGRCDNGSFTNWTVSQVQ